jgi:hypothetical protein
MTGELPRIYASLAAAAPFLLTIQAGTKIAAGG